MRAGARYTSKAPAGTTSRDDMEKATVRIETDSPFRPSEIMGDLRIVAETLYHPMRLVGFWDAAANTHMCPETELGQSCPHGAPAGHPDHVPYSRSMQRLKQAAVEVVFPHANVSMFLS